MHHGINYDIDLYLRMYFLYPWTFKPAQTKTDQIQRSGRCAFNTSAKLMTRPQLRADFSPPPHF